MINNRLFFLVFIIIFLNFRVLYSQEILSPEYEKGRFFYYTSTGFINSIDNDSFVISDRNIKKSRSVFYHGMKFRHIPEAEFTKGSFVGYKLNEKMEITEIYLIDKYEESDSL
jgi:hypothetical protein